MYTRILSLHKVAATEADALAQLRKWLNGDDRYIKEGTKQANSLDRLFISHGFNLQNDISVEILGNGNLKLVQPSQHDHTEREKNRLVIFLK